MEYFANKLLGRFKPTEDESREGSSSTTALPNSEAEVQPSGATAPATTSDSTTIAPNAARLPDAQSIYANHEDARAEQPSQATDGGFAAAVKPDGTDCVAALQALSIKDAATGTRPGSAVVEATEQLTDVKTDTALYEETETERLAPAGSLLDAERPVQAPPDTQTFNNLLPRVPDPGDERVGLVSDPVMLAHTPPEVAFNTCCPNLPGRRHVVVHALSLIFAIVYNCRSCALLLHFLLSAVQILQSNCTCSAGLMSLILKLKILQEE